MQYLKFEQKITLVYLLVGGSWIIFSDKLLFFFVSDQGLLNEIQTYKGWFFVLSTALLFFLFIRKHLEKQRNTKEALRENEKKLNAIFNHHYQLTGLIDKEGRVVMANKMALDFINATENEIIGQYFWECPWWESAQKSVVKSAFKQAKRGEFVRFETTHINFNEEVLNFDFSFRPVMDDNGEVQFVVPEGRDITARKKAEEKFLKVFQNSPLPISLTTIPEGTYIDVNPALEKISGYERSEIIGKNINEIGFYSDPEDHKRLIDSVEKNGRLYNSEFSFKVKSGKVHICRLFSELIEIQNEPCLLSVVYDETDQKNAELELIKAKEKAEESDRLKTAFLLNMSHEIRTPMNGILGFTDLLNQPNLEEVTRREFTKIITKSGDRLMNTINDIIEISRIEIGDLQQNTEVIYLPELMQYYHDFFTLQTNEKGLTYKISKQIEGEEANLKTDKNKLDSIMINLIRNAIKFTEKGSIEIGNYIDKEQLWFYVSDTGRGIPENKIELIFDRFVQGDVETSRGYEGSGIGLSIVKAYIENLEGSMEVKSTPGKGTTFLFQIPYHPVNKSLKESTPPIANPNPVKKTILIAEDEESNRKLLEMLLFKKHKLLFAKNGSEALKLFNENPEISLILMDIKMPGKFGGLEATEKIREIDQQVPIIAQTAFSMISDREKAITAGCSDYISKPFRKEKLYEIIETHLSPQTRPKE